MAGTVVVDNITTGTGATVPAATVVSGTAKAWVNFNGTGTVAIRASFNVSSITDNGVGQYRVNFTNAMPNANYSAVSMAAGTVETGDLVMYTGDSFAPRTASYVFVVCVLGTNGTIYDSPIISVVINA